MKSEKEMLEERLQRVKDVYWGLNDIIKKLPSDIPENVKDMLYNLIVKDEEIKTLMEGLDTYRVPRFLMVGRTGVGKSSLINALCNSYTAKVSDVQIGTKSCEKYEHKRDGRTILEVYDSRGIGESEYIQGMKNAENQLEEDIVKFKPDVLLFVLRCKERSRIQEDIKAVKQLKAHYYKETSNNIPVVVVLNQADEITPPEYKEPSNYPPTKVEKIEEACERVKRLLDDNNLEYEDVIAVSSYIDWGKTPEEIEKLSDKQREQLKVIKDYRYNIDCLMSCLEKCMETSASMGLLLAADCKEIMRRISKKIIGVFKTCAGTIATLPLPIGHSMVLMAMQIIMVTIIAYISGENISSKEEAWKAAEKFLKSVMGVKIGSTLFKFAATEFTKFIPVAGKVINAYIASSGTAFIGNRAIDYHINGKKLNLIKKEFEKNGFNDKGSNK